MLVFDPMSRRSTRPSRGYQSQLAILREEIRNQLQARGRVIVPAAPWLQAAETALKTRAGCGWRHDTDTPTGEVERALQAAGWGCAWFGYDVIIEQPGWVPPPPVAVQPRLFE